MRNGYTVGVLIFALLEILALANFFIFGFNRLVPPDGDAIQYVAYGKNLALSNGYSIDGKNFDIIREPGYPFFLSLIFRFFGPNNISAVKIFQALILGLAAFFVYLAFKLYERKKTGLIAALVFTLIPTYGHYANLLYSELFFTFLLSVCFYLTIRIIRKDSSFLFYGFVGAVFAVTVLTRMFIVFFPILLGLGFLFIAKKNLKKVAIFYLVFFLLVAGWAGYVFHKTGMFTITQGRLEIHLYNRAVRSTLSYRDSMYYLYSWLRRSALGGIDNEFTGKYDIIPLSREFDKILVSPGYSLNLVRNESIAVIFKNIGHYLFGNIIEWVKLVWIEHLYPPVSPLLSRFVRLIFYVLLYGLFFVSSIHFLRNRHQKMSPIFWLAAAFLFYNWAVVSFLDALPRFNMPYLFLYAIIGVAGLSSILNKQYE